MARKGLTTGRVKNMVGKASRIYLKPSLGKVIFRYPGVFRKSEKVLAINAKLEAVKGTGRAPATVCHQKWISEHPDIPHAPIDWMRSCMREEMKKLIGGGV